MTATSGGVLRAGLARAHWHPVDLWRAALGIGGDFTRQDIDDLLSDARQATESEHDILASALNDHFVTRGGDHPVRYWRELDLDLPGNGQSPAGRPGLRT